mmetsp:Transcript_10745/g.44785  ORF Transcript_10745/g.44785 Transcript_10745/m.44785 type:complete len:216 (-) Transcript_10745:3323-3970(-)
MEDPVNEGQAAEATFKGYGKYFDLSATDFVKRIIRSFIPVRPLLGYDEEEDNHKPDLYAPVWIPTTLILSLSVGRSLFLFFQSMVQGSEFQSPGLDFRTLWLSAVIIYSYCIVIPVSLFVFKLCASVDVPFFATLCVYGYSMAPVVAGALVCITPIRIVQISAMGVSFFLSTIFLFYNIWRDQTVTSRSLAYFVKLFTGIVHIGLGVVLTFLFFL